MEFTQRAYFLPVVRHRQTRCRRLWFARDDDCSSPRATPTKRAKSAPSSATGFSFSRSTIFPARRKSSRTPARSPATRQKRPLDWRAGSPTFKSQVQDSKSKFFVLADDSGLEVDALNGAPGVHSARFAALDRSADGSSANTPDADNNAKLLRLLKDVPLEKRTARFHCVMALTPGLSERIESASPVCYADEFERQTELFDGVCEGCMGFEPRGQNGFGYDPLFVPAGFEQTFAELGEDVKNKLSHRARALEKLNAYFTKLPGRY